MKSVDLNYLRSWIGRSETSTDTITPQLIARFEATFGKSLYCKRGEAPMAIHWCLAPTLVTTDSTGEDGHPARGGFLPPVPLPRRMWAGGKIDFRQPLHSGEIVTRCSRIMDVTAKSGRTGLLIFVTVEHEISTAEGIAIIDRQDIVYREAASQKLNPVADDDARPIAMNPVELREPDYFERVDVSPLLLFRYSALTFNGHRIHYDRDYAHDVEGYPGLVVHGPLQATLMLHLVSRFAGQPPKQFSFKGVAPLTDASKHITVNSMRGTQKWNLWCMDQASEVTMTGIAT